MQPQTQNPSCEVCGASLKLIPAGISKRTGKAYNPFWACPNRKFDGTGCPGRGLPHTEQKPQTQPKPPLPPQKPSYAPSDAPQVIQVSLSEVVGDVLTTVQAIYKKVVNIEKKLYEEGLMGANEELQEVNNEEVRQ